MNRSKALTLTCAAVWERVLRQTGGGHPTRRRALDGSSRACSARLPSLIRAGFRNASTPAWHGPGRSEAASGGAARLRRANSRTARGCHMPPRRHAFRCPSPASSGGGAKRAAGRGRGTRRLRPLDVCGTRRAVDGLAMNAAGRIQRDPRGDEIAPPTADTCLAPRHQAGARPIGKLA